MLRTDLESPILTDLSVVLRPPARFVRLTCSGILIISCTFFGFSQCLAQDVAEAARQEQARKENQQKKSKHVYTDEDLKQAQILTPEDRAQLEARKKQQAPPDTEKSQDAIDAEVLPLDAPLGDVARRYRRMRASLRLQESAEFHLPFADEAVLATPKPSVIVSPDPPVLVEPGGPMLAAPKFPVLVRPKVPLHVSPKPPALPRGVVLGNPTPPQVEPFQPPVKRSPFERPRIFFSAPPRVASAHPLVNPAAPPEAPAVRLTPVRPSTIPVSPAKPAAPHSIIPVKPLPAPAHHLTPARPQAPTIHSTPPSSATLPVSPRHPAAPAPDLRLMPSPRLSHRVAPEQPAAPVVSVTPSRPSPLGIESAQPVAPVARMTPSQPVAPAAPASPERLNVVMVKAGDSLWKLAEQNLGKGIRWHDLLAVNPTIVDANHIVAGSQIFLPSLVSPPNPVSRFTVRLGDTLSEIALTQLGRASSWACIAHANPAIYDANLIFEGQLLLIPASCKL